MMDIHLPADAKNMPYYGGESSALSSQVVIVHDTTEVDRIASLLESPRQ